MVLLNIVQQYDGKRNSDIFIKTQSMQVCASHRLCLVSRYNYRADQLRSVSDGLAACSTDFMIDCSNKEHGVGLSRQATIMFILFISYTNLTFASTYSNRRVDRLAQSCHPLWSQLFQVILLPISLYGIYLLTFSFIIRT